MGHSNTGSSDHTENPLQVASKKLLEHASKQAGWLPLFISVWIAVLDFNVRLPARLNLGGTSYGLPYIRDEWTIPFATFVLFLLGDALDKAVFKKEMEDSTIKNRWPDRHFSEERNKALDALKFGTGSYGAAMGVVSAALEWPFRIVASNEFAKFLRSLVLPALFIAGWQLWSEHAIAALTLEVIGAGTSVAFLKMRDPGSVASRRSALLLIAGTAFGLCAVIAARKGHEQTLLLLAVSALSLSGYLCLKHLHMSLVYEAAKDIKEKNNNSGPKPKYVEIELPDKFDRKVCLVFWDGKLVGSAMAR